MNQNGYDENNVFARIIRGELHTQKLYEDDDVLAFDDISPAAPVHIIVIPKKGNYVSFNDFTVRGTSSEISSFFKKVQHIAALRGLEEKGYRIITNTGQDALQEIFHFHIHILGGKTLDKLLA